MMKKVILFCLLALISFSLTTQTDVHEQLFKPKQAPQSGNKPGF
jgi:hypothetical protein